MTSNEANALHWQPENWSETATWKLCPLAKERIRVEIEAHYTEGYAKFIAAGCNDYDARVRALAELGDPHEAARRFSKMHLTTSEARMLEDIMHYVWISIGSNSFFAAIAFMFLKFDSELTPRDTVCWSLILLSFALTLVCCSLGRRQASPIGAVSLLLVAAAMRLPCCAALIMCNVMWLDDHPVVSACILTSIFISSRPINSFVQLRLALKLARNDHIAAEVSSDHRLSSKWQQTSR